MGSVPNINREALLLNSSEGGPSSGGQGHQWTCRGCKEAGHMRFSTVETPKNAYKSYLKQESDLIKFEVNSCIYRELL